MIKGRISTFRPKYGSKLAMRIGEATEEGGRFPYLPPSAPTTTFYPWTILYHLCIPTNKQSKSLLRQSYLHNHNARETVCYSLILTKKNGEKCANYNVVWLPPLENSNRSPRLFVGVHVNSSRWWVITRVPPPFIEE